MNTYLADKIREIAAELLQDALENGDVRAVAGDLRGQIIQGWVSAFDDICAPLDFRKDFRITAP